MTQAIEPKIHVLDLNNNQSFCRKAVVGDRAITLEQAQDQTNDLTFDCAECYEAMTGEKPV
jgi:hypothetical protein